jgi:hypothetical protein
MTQEWQIDGPKVLDIGDEHEQVRGLKVGIVGGRVDVVTHDDSPTARVEVTDVEGCPLVVRWDGQSGTLKVSHGKDSDRNLFDMVKRTLENVGRNKVRVSILVPVQTRTTVSTVSAEALVSGVRGDVKANTVSGTVTLSDLRGDLDLNTVSGNIECNDLTGPLTVNAVSGAVTVQGGDLPRIKINTVSGDITLDLTTSRAQVKSNSVSGDVTVRAPLTGFDVEGNTASGQVVVDGRKVSRRGQHGPDKGGRIREGDGSLEIKANAVSGNIVVLRAAARGAGQTGPQDSRSPQEGPTDSAPTTEVPQSTPGSVPTTRVPQVRHQDRDDDRPAVG